MIRQFIQNYHIEGIILDIDDTLYLERDYVKSGFRAVGRAIGIPEFGDKCWQCFLEGIRNHTFDIVRQDYPDLTADTMDLVQIYRKHKPDIKLCGDAQIFIQNLHHLRTAFVTDGPIDSQHAKCLSLRLLPWIDYPLFTSELGISKPSAAPFQLVSYGLNLPYTSCVYIADNPKKDFIGPHELGMKTIRIRREGSLHYHEPSGNDVDLELGSF